MKTSMESTVNIWLDTWAPNCGAPREVFEGQFRTTLTEIFDWIERDAETRKCAGAHYAAMREARKILKA